MATKTNTRSKRSVKQQTAKASPKLRIPTTVDDFKSALLVVSLVINAYILIGWITLKVTGMYDTQVATFLFNN